MSERALISIVDDDATFRASIANVLRAHGYRAASFASAAAFLAAPERNLSQCLILDVRMPDVSGPELARVLEGALQVIFVSSLDADEARALARDSGAVAFLHKPFREAELLHALTRALGAKQQDEGETR
jgi:FixJ family two-component response regulator